MNKNYSHEEFKHFWELLWGMTQKEIKARYKRTLFGFLWVIINPLLQMIVIGFVFRFFIKTPIDNYFLFLFIGLLVWNFFSLSLTKATPAIVYERTLIKKAKFPRSVIPISIILSNFVNLLLSLVLALVPVIVLRLFSLVNLLVLIPALLLLLTFTIGISLLTCALNVRFRDINFFVQAGLILWFYATPIVYQLNFIPHNIKWLWNLNPLSVIVELFRFAMIREPFPPSLTFIYGVIIIMLITYLGVWYFHSESKYFDDWV